MCFILYLKLFVVYADSRGRGAILVDQSARFRIGKVPDLRMVLVYYRVTRNVET